MTAESWAALMKPFDLPLTMMRGLISDDGVLRVSVVMMNGISVFEKEDMLRMGRRVGRD